VFRLEMGKENGRVSFAKWINIMEFLTGEKVLVPDGLIDKLGGEIHEPTTNE
jgi:hypothetical protein